MCVHRGRLAASQTLSQPTSFSAKPGTDGREKVNLKFPRIDAVAGFAVLLR